MSQWQAPKRRYTRRTDQGQFYFNGHPTCEACNIVQSQELHHICSRASHGAEEDYNYLALCQICHYAFHKLGRKSFSVRYPHLSAKIQEACRRQGRKW